MIEQYIDVHCHILPAVDDGSKDMEMTMAMVDMAYGQGVRTMIATPHYYPGHMRDPGEHLEEVYRKAISMIKEKYSDFTLLLGNEIYYKDEVVEKLNNKRIFTLADTHYILLEFSPMAEYDYLYKAVRKCLEAGYYPILAHIERYACLWKNDKHINELIRMGAYMQINAENFEGGFFSAEKRVCLKMIQNGQVHFLGSDCHNLGNRGPNLKQACDYLKEKLSPQLYHSLTVDNPNKLLEDKYL